MYSEKCAKNYHVKKGDVVEVLSSRAFPPISWPSVLARRP